MKNDYRTPNFEAGSVQCLFIRVRGVRFAWRSFPNGLYQKKAKIDLGVSLLGKIGEVGIILFRSSPGPGRAGDR